MNRKEMACAAAGLLMGAGCAPVARSLATPAADALANSTMGSPTSGAASPHLSEVLLSLVSGGGKDISSAVFRLLPKSGWSIVSNNPDLHVEIQNGHVAIVSAPQHKTESFVATATISHLDAEHFHVRCHVEASCDVVDGT
jgi:hypothetical protein